MFSFIKLLPLPVFSVLIGCSSQPKHADSEIKDDTDIQDSTEKPTDEDSPDKGSSDQDSSDEDSPDEDSSDESSSDTESPDEVVSFRVVDITPETPPALQLAAQACAGLYNRKYGGSVYTRMADKDSKWIEELSLAPFEVTNATDFLNICLTEFPSTVKYSYAEQQKLLPNIITVGAVLEAVPLDADMDLQSAHVVFDATVEFRDRNTPYLATKYVYENFVRDTTGLAMLNPGYDNSEGTVWDPALVQDMNVSMVDFVFSEKLFVIYLINGCIKLTEPNALLNEIVDANPWPKPIGVYGYASYWMVVGGYVFEAQTLCADSRSMGAIPTMVNNLSFFSTRREPIADPAEIKPNDLEEIDYDPNKTYVAFIIGDGDNVQYIMESRAEWIRQRALNCLDGEDTCPPITWSISPHLFRIAPDVLKWYYQKSHETGKDYFALPPSGHLYAYPSSLNENTIQDEFIAATEKDAELLGTTSTVHWEWFSSWQKAEQSLIPKYAKLDGSIKGLFPVNVPYMFPTFTWWTPNQFYKVIVGEDGGKVVLFVPREWRGIDGSGNLVTKKFFLTPKSMAEELAAYPRGTVTGIYMTSDGGLTLNNSIIELVKFLPEHVQLVSSDTAARLALEASESF